jgi:transketolase
VRLGLQDTYAHGASRSYLLHEYGLDAAALVRGIEELTGRRTGVSESDLASVRIEEVHSLAKAEAL